MKNLAVDICGVKLKNPLIAASGTFGFGREYDEFYDISSWGAVAVKGLTNEPREGNPPHRIAETACGALNSVGLQNPGIDAFIRGELPRLTRRGVTVIANISGATAEDYVEAVRKLSGAPVAIVELNISCPNIKQGGAQFGSSPESAALITSAARRACEHPLMVKLSPNVSDIAAIARAVLDAGADAISLINTITGMAIDAKTRRPVLANVTGGLSGPAIKPVALRMVWQAAGAVSIPVVGMGGIMTGKDAAEFLIAGANAVMIGTANIVDPFAGPRVLRELEDFMDENSVSDINSLVGTLRIE
ncbi:MAG: dihydroorotate dehydrogenase [Synergistaceae bacterium]|jgi:dihydroorotate dehydrogenase (NAD+) catalytic subunit|nr:dihydroorotate dehydrogenase [Synergistaceae bacterium]